MPGRRRRSILSWIEGEMCVDVKDWVIFLASFEKLAK